MNKNKQLSTIEEYFVKIAKERINNMACKGKSKGKKKK